VAANIEAEASIPGRLGDATDLVLGFENRDMGTALGQEIGGGEPGRSSTDNDDALARHERRRRLANYTQYLAIQLGLKRRPRVGPIRKLDRAVIAICTAKQPQRPFPSKK
jgi:hypothetical protein